MNDIPTIQENNIILRKIKLSDIEDRVKIGRHREFVHMCGGEDFEGIQFPNRETWEKWYENTVTDPYNWIIEVDGKCIGTAGFHHINKADNCATYRIGIFDTESHSKGIGTVVTKLLLKYAFEEMKWHRVDLKVLDYNKRGINCYKKCGFKIDGILRENAFIEGKYHSDIVMSILDYEYWEE